MSGNGSARSSWREIHVGDPLPGIIMDKGYLENVKILIIDDIPFTCMLVRQILKVLGARDIKEASDGSMALKLMQSFEPDLIILDWEMEPMNGIEFAQNVRDSGEDANPFVPIIMLSGHSTLAHVIEARDAGITEYVTKPFTAKSLISRIQTVINSPRPFVRTKGFFGPDRRRHEVEIEIPDRRKGDSEMDQTMSQDLVDDIMATPSAEEEEKKSDTS